ncbi:MAG: DNA-3-methyladenine glycosylase [Tildeniella nuda ZEHNDER 1965/U140]|jgi:DNA-3-methyladenine glycosylase|nr:DNA-3-methyladenine glycosylase [Tildeniella nuda ZEHNDER 1965/U140]
MNTRKAKASPLESGVQPLGIVKQSLHDSSNSQLFATNLVIDPSWLARPSTAVAPDLIGCQLVRQVSETAQEPTLWRGLIVEAEAYTPGDPACHAYRRRTDRNSVMFGPAGMTYVYLIYGMYHCLNIVTDLDGVPSAVLIRALQLETMPPWLDHETAQSDIRPKTLKPHRVAAGPGKLCRALKIDLSLNAQPLQPGQPLWLEHRSPTFQEELDQGAIALVQTTRIGLTQGADRPWRWYLAQCPAVSKL